MEKSPCSTAEEEGYFEHVDKGDHSRKVIGYFKDSTTGSYLQGQRPLYSLAYISEFLATFKCAPELLELSLFNVSKDAAKELTEMMGCYNACRRLVFPFFSPKDRGISVVVVGDGATPRAACIFAFLTLWNVYSIDPQMKSDVASWQKVKRLHVHRKRIQDFPLTSDRMVGIIPLLSFL